MERNNIINTLTNGERVTSSYAETYFNDDHCNYKIPNDDKIEIPEEELSVPGSDQWQSPSDQLINIIDLKPPFTSKITRGKTHMGILSIGDIVLNRERDRFNDYIDKLIRENEVAWGYILENEKVLVAKKVKEVYKKILETKSETMMSEIYKFYETTLEDLETYWRKEIGSLLACNHASIMSDLNNEIKEKLAQEKIKLEKVLKNRYTSEVKKINHYYKLLLENEVYRNNKLINKALHEKNDAIKAFNRQMETDNLTSTMYVMCTARKKCKIRQFFLDQHHNAEITAKVQKNKERQDAIDALKEKEKDIYEVSEEWEGKVKKILELFLKFVSFSLKLLPEQATFLLDFEKMVILQLNEIQKTPEKTSSVLIDEEELNTFAFEDVQLREKICDKEPFEIVGKTSDTPPTEYGSRETLPPHADLPMVRYKREFVYAKCDRFNEVKALIEDKRCKCTDQPPESPPPEPPPPEEPKTITPEPEPESSNESLLMDDINILHDCPVRRCEDGTERFSFPHLNSYLDYTEEKYKRATTILKNVPKEVPAVEQIQPRDIVWQELPFSATREKWHTVGTQYSSQEDIPELTYKCPCMVEPEEPDLKQTLSEKLNAIMIKRRESTLQLIQHHPNLLKVFTDESFNFIYSLK